MSRLQIFEEEKRRIIESCFSKLGPDGALQESYITHLRINEDSSYPSTPAPPDSDPSQKKPRVIIISVRSSGRVRLHKARQNVNGTFSVGKTWPIDDLSAIQGYKALNPRTQEEAQQKAWAGDLGFTVTLGKPYYWRADTAQERLFFIGSLVKIYKKYTGGSLPQLIGFEEKEMQKFLGPPRGAPPSNNQHPPPRVQPPSLQPIMQTSSSQPSIYSQASHPPSDNVGPGPNGRGIPPPRIPIDREQRPNTGNSSNPPSFRQPRPQAPNPSFATERPSTAHPTSPLPRDGPAEPFPLGGDSRQQPNPAASRRLAADQRQDNAPPNSDGPSLPSSHSSTVPLGLSAGEGVSSPPIFSSPPTNRFDRSGTPVSERDTTPNTTFTQSPPQQSRGGEEIPPIPSSSQPAFGQPPERRRPPLNIEPPRANSRDPSNMVPAPLATPSNQLGSARPPFGPPARSIERPEVPQPLRVGGSRPGTATTIQERAKQDGDDNAKFDTATVEIEQEEHKLPASLPASLAVAGPPPKKDEVVEEKTASPEPMPAEETRPGLGPMVKKKTKAEVASKFRTLALAAGATSGFKPRAGGAAEKMRLAALKSESSDGPDGITGVVPAPSLLRRETDESSRPGTAMGAAGTASQRNGSLNVPKMLDDDSATNPQVTITKAPEQKPESVRQPSEASIQPITQPEKKKIEPPKKKSLSEETREQLKSLQIDPRLLSGSRAVEFVESLDHFGWVGEGIRTKSLEEMERNVERELNRVQVGGWFEGLDESDERVTSLRKRIEGVVLEAEELEGLLTLYGVELGTLSDDIAYIEAQSQGLQVHAANQKLLASEIPKFIEQKEFNKQQAAMQAEAMRQRELQKLQREASMRSNESPTSFATGEGRDSLDERGSFDKGPLGSLRRREGLGSQSGDDEATKEKKKKMGAWKSVRKKFHAP